jgi:hypothetical protein
MYGAKLFEKPVNVAVAKHVRQRRFLRQSFELGSDAATVCHGSSPVPSKPTS